MAETYAYQCNFQDGASAGYVKYNATPDLGTPVAPGEKIVFSGVIYCRDYDVAQLTIRLTSEDASNWIYPSATFSVSAPKKVVSPFTITFTMPEAAGWFPATRTVPLLLGISVARSSGSGNSLTPTAAQSLLWLRYRIHPELKQAELYRYGYNSATQLYERRNDGLFCMCAGLRLTLAAGRGAADITVARITISPGGSVIAIPPAALAAALTGDGYVEQIEPVLFSGMEFSLDAAHTLAIEIGDAYDLAVGMVKLPRSFANLCLAGYITGGVSVGGFPRSALYDPRFDCFFPAYFHAGATGQFMGSIPGVNTYEAGETPTGGTWIDGKTIYRCIFRAEVTTTGTSVVIAELPQAVNPINIYGCAIRTSSGATYPVTMYDTSSSMHRVWLSAGIRITVETTHATDFIVIIEYTKTTEEV